MFFLIGILFFLSVICYIAFQYTNDSSEKKLIKAKATYTIKASDLVHFFSKNENKSNHLYTGEIIEITGTIKDITFLNDRTTVILKSDSASFGVICDINPNQQETINQLKKHQKIKVKGICKGFLKDVILLNCTIDLLTNE